MSQRKQVKIDISATDKASLVMKKIGREASDLRGRIEGVGSALTSLPNAAGLGALGGAIGGGALFASAIRSASSFELAMYQTTKVTTQSTASIRKELEGLPPALGSLTDLTQGYYQVLSSGVTDATQAKETLITASKLAAVAETTQTDAIRALTKMMAGYRGEITSTAQAADVLLDMEELGQTTVRELIPVIGDLASVSRTADISFQEMAGSIALLTQTAGSTSTAATQYRSLVMVLMNANESMAKVFKALGASNFNQLSGRYGFVGALKQIERAASALNIELSRVYGSSEAYMAAVALKTDDYSKATANIDAIGQKVDRTNESFKGFQSILAGVEKESAAVFENLKITVGEGFLPVIKGGIDELNLYVSGNAEQLRGYGQTAAESIVTVTKAARDLADLYASLPEELRDAAGVGLIGRIVFGKGAGAAMAVGAGLNAFGERIESLVGTGGPALSVGSWSQKTTANALLAGKLFEKMTTPGTPPSFPGSRQGYMTGVFGAPLPQPQPPQVSPQSRLPLYDNMPLPSMTVRPTPVDAFNAADEFNVAPVPNNYPPKNLMKPPALDLTDSDKKAASVTESFRTAIARMREANEAFEGNLISSSDKIEAAAQKAQQTYAAALAKINVDLEEARKKGVSQSDREAYRTEATKKAELDLAETRRKIDNDRAERERKNADIRLDFEKRYADMTGATSEAIKKSISSQVEEYKKAGVDIVRLEEWKQDQIRRASREGADGIRVALDDFRNEYSNDAKNFGQVFGDAARGIDSGFATMWDNVLEHGKISLSSFKNMFRSFLADLLHMSITRPITVQIAGVMSGVLGTAGMAGAAGGASGVSGGSSGGIGSLLGNMPFSSMLPDSWLGGAGSLLGGITSSINGWAAGAFPSVFAANPAAAALNGFAGVGPTGMLSGALGAGALGGGLGSLGYTMLGGALGLPQNKYSGLTSGVGGALGAFGGSALASSAMMGGSIMASGAALGSVFPVVGTVIGALAGGLASKLFGGKKSSPSVWIAEDASRGALTEDWVSKFQGYGKSDRVDDGARMELWGQIGGFANQTVAGFKQFANALPAEYASQVNNALSNTRVDFGYYDIQTKHWEDHAKQAMEGIQGKLFDAFGSAMANMNLSGQLGLNMDLSNQAGIEKAVQAVTVWQEMQTAFDQLLSPVAALTQQTNAANSQMTAWIDSMRALGWQEHKLAEIEARRAEYVSAVTFQLRTQFDMEMTLREAQLRGTGELVSAQQALWADWQSIMTNFGAGSDQAKRWQAYQTEALPKIAEELAKNQYQSQIDGLKQQASQQVQALKAVADQLGSLRSGLLLDARVSPLGTDRRSAEAGAGFASAYAKVMTGDVDAARNLSGSAAGYLELLKAQSGSSAEYEALFWGVMGQLGEVEKLFGAKFDGVDPGLLEQEKSNKTLAEILAEIEKLNKEMTSAVTGNAGSLQDYLAGLLNGTIRTRATGGYTPPGLTIVGEEGPELVNFDRPGMVYTAAQTRALHAASGARSTSGTGGESHLLREISGMLHTLLMAMDRVERNTRRTSDSLEIWDADGLPQTRTNTPVDYLARSAR